MRTNEERIAAMHARAAELRREKRKRETRIAGIVSIVLSLALVIALAAWMPRLSTAMTGAPGAMSASMSSARRSSSGPSPTTASPSWRMPPTSACRSLNS